MRTNKTLLYIGADCVVAMSCTGFAYIGKQPTDNWLAGKILGSKLPKDGPGAFAFGSAPDFPTYSLYAFVDLLQKAIESVPNEILRKHHTYWYRSYFAIALGIWQWNPSTMLTWPQLLRVYKPENTERTKVEYAFEINDNTHSSLQFTPHMYIPQADVESTMDHVINLTTPRPSTDKPAAIISYMVDKVREISRRNMAVRDHCMSVWIPPAEDTSRDHIFIDFFPAVPHSAVDASLEVATIHPDLPTIYSPWVISPWGYSAPSISTTGHTLTYPPWTVHISAAYPPPPSLELHSQPRKPPP